MTEGEYLAGIERVPLRIERATADGRGFICRDIAGHPVYVDKPEYLTPDERAAALAHKQLIYGSRA